jgi:hypothetical protein
MNRETYPASQSPLTGDISGPAGATSVTVTGWQTYPVASTEPEPQQIMVFGSDGVWHPEDPIVSGPDPVGSPSSNTDGTNPVQIAGVTTGNIVQELKLDTAGGITSIPIQELLLKIWVELRGVKKAVMNLDSTVLDADYTASAIELESVENGDIR